MENVVTPSFWSGKRVFLTGHTGFVGAWLTLWLREMGAQVYGYALAPPTDPSLFVVADVKSALVTDTRGDILDTQCLSAALEAAAPDTLLHLAAQPLVLESYHQPTDTFTTNAIGTMNVLEAARHAPSLRSVLIVTTDKCYANDDDGRSFSENDPLGGHDPYSASKACAEIITAAYRDSFFAAGPPIATARAGNIIGGGDWAAHRLVPDCIRAAANHQPVVLRHPAARRPWQHVLDAASGYLTLVQKMEEAPERFMGAWNFGPDAETSETNENVAAAIMKRIGGIVDLKPAAAAPREANLLSLNTHKAQAELGWRPRWPLDRALAETADWYAGWLAGKPVIEPTLAQIRAFMTS